ncbi:MAG: N-acetylglucosamine-6-phosphate deacetylase [Opitutaceae bacterium]|nr:N-acetylglucosamine-6-phosphate deacetylase [Opitutaceae bacterium]
MSDATPPAPPVPAPLFDLQVNGFAGVDFQQPDLTAAQLERALAALAARRTRILFTLVTDRIDALCAKLERTEAMRRDSRFADVIAGYHLEGPYMSPERGYHGAHPPELMKAPDLGEFERLWRASGGTIRLITLAPEWPGAAEFIRHVAARGVRTAIGHSLADDRAIDAAVAAGLTMCTHLGNGVPIQLHRHDNIIQRLLARDELDAVFIPDGIHLPPAVLRNFVRAKPPARVLFTTDCMAAAGAPPGRFHIGRLEVEVGADGVVREPGKENFAGSSLTMDAAFANVRRFLGWPAAEALAACSSRVLAALGLEEKPRP